MFQSPVRALTSLPGRSSGSLRLQSLSFPRCWSLEVTFPQVFSDVWRPGLARCCRCAAGAGCRGTCDTRPRERVGSPAAGSPMFDWVCASLRLFPKELRCERALCLSALALLTRTGCFRAACSERVAAEREVPVGSLPGFDRQGISSRGCFPAGCFSFSGSRIVLGPSRVFFRSRRPTGDVQDLGTTLFFFQL